MVTSHRERVLTAISRKETDRIPVDLGGPAWSITDSKPYGYRGLCEYMGLSDAKVIRKVGSHVVAQVDERILRAFDVDFRTISMPEPMKEVSPGVAEDMYGIRWNYTDYHYYPAEHPLAGAATVEEIEDYDGWPSPKNPIFTVGMRSKARALYEGTDFAITADTGSARNIFHRYSQLRGFEQWFIDMRRNPGIFEALTQKIYQVHTDLLSAFLGEVSDYVDIVFFTEDMGTQKSPFLSIEDFRRFVKPWLKMRVDSLRKFAPKSKVLYHSCGSVYRLIPDFMDCGIDILNPIQPMAREMEPQRLKGEFGDRLCFHGGIDVQGVLPTGTPAQVRDYVANVVEVMSKGGGYILAPSHQIQGDIPPENIVTMYKTAIKRPS
jgi:uroporphyrinogen decarboxylase